MTDPDVSNLLVTNLDEMTISTDIDSDAASDASSECVCNDCREKESTTLRTLEELCYIPEDLCVLCSAIISPVAHHCWSCGIGVCVACASSVSCDPCHVCRAPRSKTFQGMQAFLKYNLCVGENAELTVARYLRKDPLGMQSCIFDLHRTDTAVSCFPCDPSTGTGLGSGPSSTRRYDLKTFLKESHTVYAILHVTSRPGTDVCFEAAVKATGKGKSGVGLGATFESVSRKDIHSILKALRKRTCDPIHVVPCAQPRELRLLETTIRHLRPEPHVVGAIIVTDGTNRVERDFKKDGLTFQWDYGFMDDVCHIMRSDLMVRATLFTNVSEDSDEEDTVHMIAFKGRYAYEAVKK